MPMDNEIVYYETPAGRAIIQIWRRGMWQFLREATFLERKFKQPFEGEYRQISAVGPGEKSEQPIMCGWQEI